MGLWDLKQRNKTGVGIELIKCDSIVTCAELLSWILSQAENSPFHHRGFFFPLIYQHIICILHTSLTGV